MGTSASSKLLSLALLLPQVCTERWQMRKMRIPHQSPPIDLKTKSVQEDTATHRAADCEVVLLLRDENVNDRRDKCAVGFRSDGSQDRTSERR